MLHVYTLTLRAQPILLLFFANDCLLLAQVAKRNAIIFKRVLEDIMLLQAKSESLQIGYLLQLEGQATREAIH